MAEIRSYESMLQEGRKHLPESVFEKERFEIPKVRGQIQGNKTIISNFSQIAQVLHRDSDHFLKYILRELATPGDLKNTGLIVGAKIAASRINDKIRQYANDFVFCKDCGKPDTKMTKEEGFTFLTCMVCGSKYRVKSKI